MKLIGLRPASSTQPAEGHGAFASAQQQGAMQLSDAGADFIGRGYENPAMVGYNAKSGL